MLVRSHLPRSTPYILLVSVVACGRAPEPTASPSPRPSDPWSAEVTARIRDGAHAFGTDGADFTAMSPERGLTGRFDLDGAWLETEDDGFMVRSLAVGRSGAMTVIDPTSPTLGACIPGREDPEGACIARLEYLNGDVTEWWAADDQGFQQGWSVASAPAGGGALTIEVEVTGATATVAEGDLWLETDGGIGWTVSGLVAWDADGTVLDARFDRMEDGFAVVVNDTDAVYPVEIDPVYTTAATTLDAEATGDYFGYSVAGAGDVNGDGYDDVVVGALGYSSFTGRAYVFAGSSAGVSSTATTTLTGGATSDYFGVSVSGVGDVNGDGYDDVIVGAPWYSSRTGRAYVHVGSSAGLSSTATTTLTGGATSDIFGSSLSGAGDVIADGYDDVIVGAVGYSSSTGRAYVFAGSSAGVSSTATTTLTGGATSDCFGVSVSGAGDVNGDGYDDVVVGAPYSGSGTGQAYVYAGSSTGVSSAASASWTGGTNSDYFGWSVSGAGDVNGDGYDDVIVGAPYYTSFTGRAYVYAGSSGGSATIATTILTGGAADEGLGWSVSGAGDVNGDGYDDVIVGAPGYSSFTGRAYVYAGSSGGSASIATTVLTGEAAYDYFGRSVSGAGDVNGDGYNDVIVGGYGYNSSTGRAYVYTGYADTDGDGIATALDCDDTDATVGEASTRYVDADGDGYGSTTTGTACAAASGYADVSTDCDDSSAATNPAAQELCDDENADEDCDGTADDLDASSLGQSTFYADGDADGYGGATTGKYCDPPVGYTVDSTDCNDTIAGINPGATDIEDDGIDQDCDGGDSSGRDPSVDSGTDSGDKSPAGCGCAATEGSAAGAVALGLLMLLGRRRARWRRHPSDACQA